VLEVTEKLSVDIDRLINIASLPLNATDCDMEV
jgi:hypothetical protein